MTLLSELDRGDGPMEAHLGPFATGAPGLGYREYLAEFDADAQMWRQIVPNQRGRGLALGRWGLHPYEEFEGLIEPVMFESDPLWIPMLVEWASLTCLDGAQIKPDPWYFENFHNGEAEGGEDALPMVGLLSAHAVWPSLTGPWAVHTAGGIWWELMDSNGSSQVDMVVPVTHVLPLEDEQVLIALTETIQRIEKLWPMDNCGPTSLGMSEGWIGGGWPPGDLEEELEAVKSAGHDDACIKVEHRGTPMEHRYLQCVWSPIDGVCTPCGGAPHISAVVDAFADAIPYERLAFDPLLIPYWDQLKDRNLRFYESLLLTQETERTRGRTWYYSYLQRWSPWGHSTQVPVRHPV